MQIDRLSKKLEGISDASKKGRRVKDLFRIITNCRELWLEAYANIYSNKGAITEGVNANTLDGFSQERVERIIEKLKNREYRFSPVRRAYIPKYEIQGEIQTLKVFRLKHMTSGVKLQGVDSVPYIPHLMLARSGLIQRLNARICEYCGVSDCACQVHHIRKLKDLESRPNLMLWEKRMIAMRRKTYVLCPECHTLLHAGKLPDKRYQERSLTG